MLSNYVGEEKFLNGVSLYLKKKLFANSKTLDLWEGIGSATGLDIPAVMDNWITKACIATARLQSLTNSVLADWIPRSHCH